MLTAGIIAAAGLLFLVFKLGIRRVISYDLAFDVAITAVLMVSLAGTFSGMMAALLGGLIGFLQPLRMPRNTQVTTSHISGRLQNLMVHGATDLLITTSISLATSLRMKHMTAIPTTKKKTGANRKN